MERIRAGRGWVGGVVVGGGLLAGVLSHCRRVEAAIVVLKVRRRVVEKTRMLGDFQIFSLFGGTALFFSTNAVVCDSSMTTLMHYC